MRFSQRIKTSLVGNLRNLGIWEDEKVRTIHTMLLAACATLGATASYAQEVANAPSASLESIRSQPLTEPGALAMMAAGDNWAGTNAFRKLAGKNGSALNRFNLATGYQRTGRLDQAKVIYRDLLVDGRFTLVSAVAPGGTSRTFNAADEAASRLLYIQWLQDGGRQRIASAPLSGAVSAEQAAVPVAATEGGRGGDVSDEQAAAFDEMARSRGGVTP
jgi:hypothetical protein